MSLSKDAALVEKVSVRPDVIQNLLFEIDEHIADHSVKALINLCGDLKISTHLSAHFDEIARKILSRNSLLVFYSMLLRNISHHPQVVENMSSEFIPKLFDLLLLDFTNSHLLNFFVNYSAHKNGRQFFVGSNLESLLSKVFDQNLEFQKGIYSILRNCCFDVDQHILFLTDFYLTFVLWPLYQVDCIDENEGECFPWKEDLVSGKQRIQDSELKILLIDTLILLATTRTGRETLRSRNCYFILRELDLAETEEKVKLATDEIVQLLIRDEETIPEIE